VPPESGGSFGGGEGADLDLVIEHAGLGEHVEKYRELIEDIKKSKEAVADAEIEAAKRLRAEAETAASEFSEAAGVAQKAGEESEAQSQAFSRVFTEYKQLVTSIDSLRAVLLDEEEDEDDDTEEDEEGVRRRATSTKRGDLGKKIGNFFNLYKQAGQALTSAGRLVGGTITTMGVGGIIGLMLYGVHYEEKLRAEGERYAQLWEKTIASGDAKGYAVAHQHMAQLGRQFADLVDTFRLSKAEATAVTRTLADSGVSIEEATAKTNIYVGGARASVAIATAAIDTTLRLPEGTAAKTANQMMQQYGMSAQEATEMTGKLALAGRDSGIGVQSFVNDVLTATGQMRQYGATVQDGLNMAHGLQRMLVERGLEPHFAATTAIMATGQISAGLAGMSKGMQMAVAEKMGLGTDLAAYYALRDAYMDPEKGPGVALKMARATVDLFRGGRRMTREEIGVALERVMPQLGPQSALIMIQAVDTLQNTNATKEERTKAEKTFNDAFKKERATHTDFETGFKDVARDIARIGLGLFNLIAVGLAELVIGLRYLPLLLKDKLSVIPGFSDLTDSEKAQMGRLETTFWDAESTNEKVLKDIGKGFSGLGQHAKALLPDSAGMNAFMGAITTPDAVKRMAARLMSGQSKAGITAALRSSRDVIQTVASRGGQRLATGTSLTPDQQMALAQAQSSGDYSGVQDLLSDIAYETEDDRGTWADRGFLEGRPNIAITGVEFGSARGENLPVTIHFVTIPSEQGRRIALAAGSEKGRDALTSAAAPSAAAEADARSEGTNASAGGGMTSGAFRGRLRDPSIPLVQFDPLGGAGNLFGGSFSHQFVKGGKKGAVHGAQDIVMPGGTPVYAPVTGRITPDTGPSRVSIYDPNSGMTHVLAHIDKSEDIPKGRGGNWRNWPAIDAGTRIGVLSAHASSPSVTVKGAKIESGAHLHYRIYDPSTYRRRPISEEAGAENRWGAVDPYPYLKALRRGG